MKHVVVREVRQGSVYQSSPEGRWTLEMAKQGNDEVDWHVRQAVFVVQDLFSH